MGNVTVRVGQLGAQVVNGSAVTGNYAGLLKDGRLFDTSLESVAHDASQPKMTTSFKDRGTGYSPFSFTVGSGVIPGFTNLAQRAKVGETVTAPIPAADAYSSGNMYQNALVKRDLVFELEIVSAK